MTRYDRFDRFEKSAQDDSVTKFLTIVASGIIGFIIGHSLFPKKSKGFGGTIGAVLGLFVVPWLLRQFTSAAEPTNPSLPTTSGNLPPKPPSSGTQPPQGSQTKPPSSGIQPPTQPLQGPQPKPQPPTQLPQGSSSNKPLQNKQPPTIAEIRQLPYAHWSGENLYGMLQRYLQAQQQAGKLNDPRIQTTMRNIQKFWNNWFEKIKSGQKYAPKYREFVNAVVPKQWGISVEPFMLEPEQNETLSRIYKTLYLRAQAIKEYQKDNRFNIYQYLKEKNDPLVDYDETLKSYYNKLKQETNTRPSTSDQDTTKTESSETRPELPVLSEDGTIPVWDLPIEPQKTGTP